MKTVKLVCMTMMSMAMIMVSCSGEDGTTGPAGTDGIDGTDGANGLDGIACWDLNGNGEGDPEEDTNGDTLVDALDCQGVDGTNGNANVTEHSFNLDMFSDYTSLNLDLNNIVDNPANYAYLYYLVVDFGEEFRISIPGPLGIGEDVDAGVFNNQSTGDLTIHFLQNGSPYEIPGSPFPELIVVAIELSNTGKTSENVMSELKAAGVDTSDYNAVAEYFGLE